MLELTRRGLLALGLLVFATGAGDDYPEARILPEVGIALHLRPGTVVDVRVEPDDGETWQAIVTLSPEATAEFGAMTELNVGKILTFILDGEVLMQPRVVEPIQGGVFIVRTITEAQAKRLTLLATKP